MYNNQKMRMTMFLGNLRESRNDAVFHAQPRLNQSCLRSFGTIKIVGLRLPFFINFVSAGSPSDAGDPFQRHLDLSKYLIRHPKSTYYFKVTGYSMMKAGINHNDLLVVDTALKAKHRDIVIAVINGELIVRRLHMDSMQKTLLSANAEFPAIVVTKEMSFFVQGVVTTVIRTFNPLPYDNHFKDISYPHI
jgi:DNA polymerase V